MPLPADLALTTIDGKPAALADFDGEALLIVNVASQCGFTPQYAGLEELHRRFRGRGFAVLGIPLRPVRPSGAGRRARKSKASAPTIST